MIIVRFHLGLCRNITNIFHYHPYLHNMLETYKEALLKTSSKFQGSNILNCLQFDSELTAKSTITKTFNSNA